MSTGSKIEALHELKEENEVFYSAESLDETHVHVDSSVFFSYLAEKKPYGTVPLEVFLLPPSERLAWLGISFIDHDSNDKGSP